MDENANTPKPMSANDLLKEQWKNFKKVTEERGRYIVDADGNKRLVYNSDDVSTATQRTLNETEVGRDMLSEHQANLELALKLKAEQQGRPVTPISEVPEAAAPVAPKPKTTTAQKIVSVLFVLILIGVIIVLTAMNM